MKYTNVPRPDGWGDFTMLSGSGSWRIVDDGYGDELELHHKGYIQNVEVFGSKEYLMRFMIDVDLNKGLLLKKRTPTSNAPSVSPQPAADATKKGHSVVSPVIEESVQHSLA